MYGKTAYLIARRRVNPANETAFLPMAMALAYLLLYHTWQVEAVDLTYAGKLGNQHD